MRGMTWGHSRAITPLEAISRAAADQGAEPISWDVRSLWDFGEGDLTTLARRYDLLVLDHPFIGTAVERGLLLPLDEPVGQEVITELEMSSLSTSQISYRHAGNTWALAIDAATQVAVYRADQLGPNPPRSFDDALSLGERSVTPLSPIDSLMTWFSITATLGERSPFAEGPFGPSEELAEQALHMLTRLMLAGGPRQLRMNPIDVLNLMSSSTAVIYSPWVYGYSNYSRRGYADVLLTAASSPDLGAGTARTALGGAGVAVSAFASDPEAAVAAATRMVGSASQEGVYLECGGQPARTSAWVRAAADGIGERFFGPALAPTAVAWHRPNWPGFAADQHRAAAALHRFLEAACGRVPGDAAVKAMVSALVAILNEHAVGQDAD